jgi:dipeptidyl aminopeptidase/acylaminoacyl peptidase
MYKIILGIFILCYGLYNAYTGDYTNSYSLIESVGSSFFLIVVGWTLFWSGLGKDKKLVFNYFDNFLKSHSLNLQNNSPLLKRNNGWIFVFLLMVIVFYWFQYRPSEIRKECYKMLTVSHYDFDEHFKYYEPEYNSCLIKNGITK